MQENDFVPIIENILGHIVKYGDTNWETTIPCGSEGSLKYQIIENPDKSSIAAYTIPIWGDLRNYDDVDEIKNWFLSVCDKMYVRNAVINIDVEFKDEISFYYRKNINDENGVLV